MTRLTRRQALRLAALALISGALVACDATSASLSPTPSAATRAVTPPVTETPTRRQPLGGGPTVSITPIGAFYTVAITKRSDWFTSEAWVVSLSGEFERPQTLLLADVQALPAVEDMRTLECIGNPVGGNLIGNAIWKGARLKDVLEHAGLKSMAIEIKFGAADGYSTSIPVSLATDPRSLLVYEMNGVPLPNEHGAPVRVLLPGRYGQKQPKWITSIEAITKPYLGHWERQGWSNDAIVRINSQIRTPDDGEIISSEIFPVSGTVFSSHHGVARLEVSTDGGQTWHEARLVRGPSPQAWVEWRYEWTPPASGSYTIIARGTDGEGNQQPIASSRLLVPDGSLEGVWTAHRVVVAVSK